MRITRVLALIGIGGAFLMILPGCSAPHPTPVATPSPVAPLPVAQTPDPPEQADPLIQKMQALAAAPEHEATGAALKLRAISHPLLQKRFIYQTYPAGISKLNKCGHYFDIERASNLTEHIALTKIYLILPRTTVK